MIKVQKVSEMTKEQKKKRIAPLVKINSFCECKKDCPFVCKGECGCLVCKDTYSDYLSMLKY